MKKFIGILAVLFCVFCFTSVCLAAPKAKKAKKVAAPYVAKVIPLVTLANGPETKSSFVFHFYNMTFFVPPFRAKLPKLPAAMEMKRFGSLENPYARDDDEDAPAENILEPGYVYAFRITDPESKKYKIVLNPLDKKPEKYLNAQLSYEEINDLITFLENGEVRVLQEIALSSWFDSNFDGNKFLFVPSYKQVKKDVTIEMPLEKLHQGNFDSEEYNVIGTTRPNSFFINAHEIFIDKPYRFNGEVLRDFFLSDLRLQKTVPVFWSESCDLMYHILILEKKDADNDFFEGGNDSVMVKADNLTRQVAQRMIYDREIDDNCLREKKGNLRDTITLRAPSISFAGDEQDSFQVEASSGACCQGARRCAMWVYRKNPNNGEFYKVLGPVYPDEIQVLESSNSNKDMFDLKVVYPAGLNYPGLAEIYRFNGIIYTKIKEFRL